MGEFNAAHTLSEVKERNEQLSEGQKLVPILAAVIAVFAALATLFANHSSISGLAMKNEAILSKSKAVDQWNYYQAKEIKLLINQSFIDSGVVMNTANLTKMSRNVSREEKKAAGAMKDARNLDKQSEEEYNRAERFMLSYEKFEVAATFFEVSIVLVSITALMRTRMLMYIGCVATLVGVVFFAQGVFLR